MLIVPFHFLQDDDVVVQVDTSNMKWFSYTYKKSQGSGKFSVLSQGACKRGVVLGDNGHAEFKWKQCKYEDIEQYMGSTKGNTMNVHAAKEEVTQKKEAANATKYNDKMKVLEAKQKAKDKALQRNEYLQFKREANKLFKKDQIRQARWPSKTFTNTIFNFHLEF